MAHPRYTQIDPDTPGTYHITKRAVRRAFLLGQDKYSGKDLNHRRQWVVDLAAFLAKNCCIQLHGYAVMENHVHLVLTNRPDLAALLTADDIRQRWWGLFHDENEKPSAEWLAARKSRKWLAKARQNLCSISFFMKLFSERIARRANKEDNVKGHFWESRFGCQKVLGPEAMLEIMAYVDLNPIRAGIAESLEKSDSTSIQQRLLGGAEPPLQPIQKEPIPTDPGSLHLMLDFKDYLQHCQFRIQTGARSKIDHMHTVVKTCSRVIGNKEEMAQEAARRGQKRFRGQELMATVFDKK